MDAIAGEKDESTLGMTNFRKMDVGTVVTLNISAAAGVTLIDDVAA